MHTIFWSENLKGGDYLEDIGLGRKITLEWILGVYGGKLWTGVIWLRMASSAGPL
jgi:hypothetical protein